MFQSCRLPAAVDVKCFLLHVTTSYLQHVFCKCFATFLQSFSITHLRNILEVVTCKIKH